jgi:uncharacterized protein (TIGR00255 family)
MRILVPPLDDVRSVEKQPVALAPVRSMTGYAAARRQTSAGEFSVSLRSVNHRGLDLHFHQSTDLAQFENAMRSVLKQNIERGHVEIRLSLTRDGGPSQLGYNRELLGSYVELFRRACQEFQLESKPDLNAFIGIPGVLDAADDSKPLSTALEPEILHLLTECIADLNSYRAREGSELRAEIEREIAAVESHTSHLSALRAEAIPQFVERLRQRVEELLNESGISETRLAQEAALLADRSDVQEEVTRLAVHTQELRRIMSLGGAIGKKLDFLLQEMNRETNTILSKTSGVGEAGLAITNIGLALKASIERIREQALNLE